MPHGARTLHTHTQENELRATPSNSNPANNSSQVIFHTNVNKVKEHGYIHNITNKVKQRKVQWCSVEQPEPGIPSAQDRVGGHTDNKNIRMFHRTTN